jgi:translation initiation factor 1
MKKKSDLHGYVYSTDPAFNFQNEQEHTETLAATAQKLKVRLDNRNRAGKAVTLVQGFIGTNDALEDLGKKIKSYCGTGGSVKDGCIIIQGDQRDKVLQWLLKNDFRLTKRI